MNEVEIFEFPYGAFLKQRMEFVLLRDDDLQSKIMRIIEYRMIRMKSVWLEKVAQAIEEGKSEPPEPDYWVTLSYAQITVQLYMFNSSRSGKNKDIVEGKKNSLSRNTLGKAVGALANDGYVLTRPNPDKTKEYDATQYKLNIPLIQEHLNRLPKDAKLPIIYLASNGRINGEPCTIFLHPPCTEFLQGDAQNLDMGCTEFLQGDVKNSYHLIDIEIETEKKVNRTLSLVGNNTSPLLEETIQKQQEELNSLKKLVVQLKNALSSGKNTVLDGGNILHTENVTSKSPRDENAGVTQEAERIAPPQKETPEIASQGEITPPSKNEEEIQPASYSPNVATKNQGKRERKNNKSNKVIDLKASEIALPQKPDHLTHPYDVELFIELGDYYRGSKLPVNHREGTKYMQAYEAAKTAVAKKLPFEKVDEVFAMLKDRGVEIGMPWLNDPDWNYPADLWVVINNFDYKIKRVNQLKKQHEGSPSSQDANGNIRQFPQTAPQERPSVLVSSEARARNLARLQAKVAAAQAQAQ